MMKWIILSLCMIIFIPSQPSMIIIFPMMTMLWITIFQSPPLFLCSSFSFSLDNLSLILISLSLMSSTLILISSFNFNKIYFFISSILILLLLSFSSANSFLFYMSFESVLIPTLFLITIKGSSPERIQAGVYLLIYTILGSLPLLMSILMMSNLSLFPLSYSSPTNFHFPILFMLAFLVKLPMFLFHLWLPKAHVEAPLEGSMILAAVLLKLGGYGLIRFMPFIKLIKLSLSSSIIAISLLGAFFTSMNCLRQKDLKALIAYSSVAHMALTISSIMTLKPLGIHAAILMMFAHGLSSSALFFLVTIIYNQTHSRNILMFKGLLMLFPNLTFWWFIFSMINISAPPSVNLISEILIFSSLSSMSLLNLIPTFMASIFTASFSIFLFSNISHNSNLNYSISTQPSYKSSISLLCHSLPLIFLSIKPEIMYM